MMPNTSHDPVEHLADLLHARGLATPALMLFDTFAPLGFIGEQALVAFGPLMPLQTWRATAADMVQILQDEQDRERLRALLADNSTHHS